MHKLFVVPTPVGNLEDMTFRAIRTLRESDVILCEDTRQSIKLLQHFEIEGKLVALNKVNEHKIVDYYIDRILSGTKISLISDAGTPIISDPRSLLVQKCIANNITIECMPGATAFVPALVNSGFDLSEFVFLGFPPHKKGRQTFIKQIASEKRTLVLYESPYRMVKFLEEFLEFVGDDRQISVSREISKKFEETVRGNASFLLSHFSIKAPKGEFVVCISST